MVWAEYVYLLKEEEFIESEEDVYKIGLTTLSKNKRFCSYSKGSSLFFQMQCIDCKKLEKKIIVSFTKKYILRSDLGKEYFEGDLNSMLHDISNLTLQHNEDNDFNNRNNVTNKNEDTDGDSDISEDTVNKIKFKKSNFIPINIDQKYMAYVDIFKNLKYNKKRVRVRSYDNYIFATDICNITNKKFSHYKEQYTTQLFFKKLSLNLEVSIKKLIEIRNGGGSKKQGTWVHPIIAIHLAEWASYDLYITILNKISLSTIDKSTKMNSTVINNINKFINTLSNEQTKMHYYNIIKKLNW
jgi:hypothetical protein